MGWRCGGTFFRFDSLVTTLATAHCYGNKLHFNEVLLDALTDFTETLHKYPIWVHDVVELFSF